MPRSILYDDTNLAVARLLGDGTRARTRAFAGLRSRYLFRDRFGRPGKGNDEGKVEGPVGYARRNFLVPVPVCASFAALNAQLERHCLDRLDHRLRGHAESIGERPERDLAALQPRPATAYEACERKAARVSSLALVRYDRNDYSVPTAYGRRPVLVKGDVDEVVIACGAEVIARHPRAPMGARTPPSTRGTTWRCWSARSAPSTRRRRSRAGTCPRRSRRCAACWRRAWASPASGSTCRSCASWRRSGWRMSMRPLREALGLGAIGFDAVKHLVLCRIERRPPTLDLTPYPYLPRVAVATTPARAYLALLAGAGR